MAEQLTRDIERLVKLAEYDDERGICSRCGEGFPCCADFEVLPRDVMHKLACEKYGWGDLCSQCDEELSHDPEWMDPRTKEFDCG